MILTCPKCANRYHIELPSKTLELLAVCPSCAHRWLAKNPPRKSFLLEEDVPQELAPKPKETFLTRAQDNKKLVLTLLFLCLLTGYILQPLVKSGFNSLFSLLKVQEMQINALSVENIVHTFDETSKHITISWELKNNTSSSQDLKAFRIQLFNKCTKSDGDCLVKEIKFKPSKDIILSKEILRFEHSEKIFTPLTKISIFP